MVHFLTMNLPVCVNLSYCRYSASRHIFLDAHYGYNQGSSTTYKTAHCVCAYVSSIFCQQFIPKPTTEKKNWKQILAEMPISCDVRQGFHGSDYEECDLLGYKNPVHTWQETHYVSATEPSLLMLCKICGFHGSDYEECHLGMLQHVAVVRTDVLKEHITSNMVTRISKH
jgi:hypothetical protein